MRRLALAALLCGALNAAGADTAAPPLVSNERLGYAFEYPRVLAEQRLFGIAHGVALLADSCREVEPSAQATAVAYARWHEQQQLQIEDLKSNLAVFYYGRRAHEASWQHIAAALNLRQKLDLAPEQRTAACASLPEALRQPRYDLTALFQLEAALAAMNQGIRTETQASVCATKLPEAERAALAAAYADWQRNETPALETARGQLQYYWNSTATPGQPEGWMEAAKLRYSNPPANTCKALAASLREPEASLAYSFAPAPAMPLTEETGLEATEQVNAVSSTTPAAVLALDTPAAEAHATEPVAKPGNLFDSMMRLFDERPYEDAARDGTGDTGRKSP